jgi:hypothetical protein
MLQKRSIFFLVASAAIVITVWVITPVSVAAQANAPARSDLAGDWQLNRDLSDNPQTKFESMGGEGGHAGHGGPPGVHGQGLEEIRNLMLNAPTRFVLTQDEEKVVLIEPNGHMQTLPTNNRMVKIDGQDVQTGWENNRLVSETTIGNTKLIETYERSPGGRQLILTIGADVHGQQVGVRRVYDAVTESRRK